jgi:hypothetical protein
MKLNAVLIIHSTANLNPERVFNPQKKRYQDRLYQIELLKEQWLTKNRYELILCSCECIYTQTLHTVGRTKISTA